MLIPIGTATAADSAAGSAVDDAANNAASSAANNTAGYAAGYTSASVDIRSSIIFKDTPVDYALKGDDFDSWAITPMIWSGVYYKINTNASTEKMYIYPYSGSSPMTFNEDHTAAERPSKVDIYYETFPIVTNYSYKNWTYGVTDEGKSQYGVYSTINLFGDSYVLISPDNYVLNPGEKELEYKYTPEMTKLVELVIDKSSKYNRSAGEEISLGNGYVVIPEEIDVMRQKVKLNLYKDDVLLDSAVVYAGSGSSNCSDDDDDDNDRSKDKSDSSSDTGNTANSASYDNSDTMISKGDVLGEKNVTYFRCRVSSIFDGADHPIVEINGVWLIDFETAFEVEDADFGYFKEDGIGPDSIKYKAENIGVTENTTIPLGGKTNFETLGIFLPHSWGFYVKNIETAAKSYEIRSHILTSDNYKEGIEAFNFAGFYSDRYTGTGSEKFSILVDDLGYSNRVIPEGCLTYVITPVSTNYRGGLEGNYYVMGLLGNTYIPFSETNTQKMMELLITTGVKRTLAVGQPFVLGNYSIVPTAIDVAGNKVYLEILRDGESIGNSTVSTNGDEAGKTWTLNKTVLGDEVTVAKIYVDMVFQGDSDSFVVLEGIWLADYTTAREISTSDEFEKLDFIGQNNVDGINQLVFISNEEIVLESNKKIELTDGFTLKVASNRSTLRFYLSTTESLRNSSSSDRSTGDSENESKDTNDTNDTEISADSASVENSNSGFASDSDSSSSSWKSDVIAASGILTIFAGAGFLFWNKNGKK
ncbi:S-layer protein domain-containing protein [Methanimicrococcus hongohii]|uniref:S-layer protein domain-containing protein n=1 Tax=Methanimicrococcus hongohii TaxID=3028295 RepID=UPI00292F515F|nr:S-layer protein domain-containing protein [Methanimicrococcus sp. Hf6]